jgi:AcrR family transcriptional regulator
MSRRSSGRREDILNAARRLFLDQGYAQTSVNDIVRAVGVAQGTFYLYFQSKRDLVLALVQGLHDHRVADCFEPAIAGVSDWDERLLSTMRAAFHVLEAEADILSLLHLGLALEVEVVDEMTSSVRDQTIAKWAELLREGATDGVFDVPDPIALAGLIVAMLEFAAHECFIHRKQELVSSYQDAIARILRGIQRETHIKTLRLEVID